MIRKPLKSLLIPLFVALLLIAGVTPSVRGFFQQSYTLKELQNQKLNWEVCYSSFKCATLKVPVDYNHLGKDFFHLKVLKHEATNPAKRIGSIVVNPGGPGGSGFDYAYNAEYIVSQEINQRFDIVGFDPRGVNLSDPIRCLSDKQEDIYLASDGKAGSAALEAQLISAAKMFATACAKVAGKRLGHYSTVETAKDMEILRSAMGEDKLNYLGKSYGTFLGTLYASLYPQHVGRFVLDGAVDPNVSIRNQNLVQARGFDLALDDFFKQSKTVTKAQLVKLLSQAEVRPISGDNHRIVTPALLITAVASALYDPQAGWPRLEPALLKAITNSKGQLLLDLADEYSHRDANGHYTDNQDDISQVISCLDFRDSRTLAQIKADEPVFAKTAPIFGPFLTFAGLTCHYWSTGVVAFPKPLSGLKTPPILIIGVTADPATPYEWALSLHKAFLSSSLLTFNGDGHTGHNRGSSCIDSKVDAYFLTGKTPAEPVSCSA